MNISLHGIEFGSPEYVRITKHGEEVGEFRDNVRQLTELVEDIESNSNKLRWEDRSELAHVRDILIGIIGTD